MAQEFAKKFYASRQWKQCRLSYIASVHGLCERCNEAGVIKAGLILHHKIKLTPSNINDADVALNHVNLQFLCLECHNVEHGEQHEVLRQGLVFTEDGDVVNISPHSDDI